MIWIRRVTAIGILVLCLAVAITCKYDDDDNAGSGDDDTGSSNGGDDTDDEGLPESCQTNAPPETLSVRVLVNGEHRDEPVTLYDNDKLEFEFEYKDSECNLEGGWFVLICDDGFFTFDGNMLHGIGCSSEEEGEPFRKEIDPGLLTLHESIKVGLADNCEDIGNQIPVDITVFFSDN